MSEITSKIVKQTDEKLWEYFEPYLREAGIKGEITKGKLKWRVLILLIHSLYLFLKLLYMFKKIIKYLLPKDFIFFYQNWNYLKNQPFFGLKLKYAVFIIPIPFLLFALLVVLHFLKWINYL